MGYNHLPHDGEHMLLGLGSLETALPYWLCIISTIGCVVYGIIHWNNAGTPDTITISSLVQDTADN